MLAAFLWRAVQKSIEPPQNTVPNATSIHLGDGSTQSVSPPIHCMIPQLKEKGGRDRVSGTSRKMRSGEASFRKRDFSGRGPKVAVSNELVPLTKVEIDCRP